MKVLFTADLHIKLGQKNIPVDWARNRFKLLFTQLAELSNSVELTILGGDIFDKLPSMDELELYFELVSSLNGKVIIYSGNHEALKKNTTFLTYLKTVTNRLNPNAQILDDFANICNIDFIPYNKLKDWEKDPDNTFVGLSRILCTHVRGEIPPHVKPEIPLELFNKWEVVLAGDLHSYDNCQRNILYPGSPVTTSFHRGPVDTGVIILDTDTLGHTWHKLQIPQLIRKTIKAGEPMVPGDFDHIVYEVEGDLSELSNLEDTELLDKKVLNRATDTALILTHEMTIVDEVREYLTYVLELKEATIEKVIHELNGVIGTHGINTV